MKSTFQTVEVPDVTLFTYLFGKLSPTSAAKPALIDGPSGRSLSYGDLVSSIGHLAGALAARGFRKAEVAGILSQNSPEFAIVFHGVLRAGGTVTPLNVLYTVEEIATQLRDAGATTLFTVSALLPIAAQAAVLAGIAPDRLFVIDGTEGRLTLMSLLAERLPAPKIELDPAEHIAVLPYSSGTTGRPKGVMLTHRNLVANLVQVRDGIAIGAADRVVAVLPFFHIYGLTVLLNFALRQQATMVTMSRFDLKEFLRTIETYRLTWVFVAPPIALALAKHPMVDEYDLSSVRVVLSGAAPLDRTLAEAVSARLNCVVTQGYGMTELSPVSHVIPAERVDIDRSSIGLLLAGTEARLVDADGLDIRPRPDGPSQPGELLIRGPQVMRGYLNNPEATSATIDAQGWLHTGDVATVTADGVWTIVDRIKELIKYKGYQVAPATLEAILLTHPAIADVAVVGITRSDGLEIPKAFIVLQAGKTLDMQEVMDYVADRVAPHEKVRAVEFIDVIPKSSSGKILRRQLRDRTGQPA